MKCVKKLRLNSMEGECIGDETDPRLARLSGWVAFATDRLIKSEVGAAVIEYVLILVVMVGVILGGMYQLNDAFKQWAQSYFGEYLACLIETGELPTLGGGGGFAGECSQLYQEFSLANGRPLVGKGVGGGAGGGLGSGTGGDENDGGADSGGDTGVYTGSAGGGASVVQSVPSADLGSSSPKRFRAPRPGGSAVEGKGDNLYTGSTDATDLGSYESGKSVRIPMRRAIGYAGARYSDEDDREKQQSTVVDSSQVMPEQRKGPEMIKVNRKVAAADEGPEIEEFTFGKFFRYLVIAAIIIAVVIFIGGQAMQVSKSM